MKKLLLASVAAALLVGVSGSAMAARVLTIEPSHRTVIKEFVVKRHMHPVTLQGNIVVGGTLPSSVTVETVPADLYASVPEIQNYEYFYWGDKVVLVDPETREIVQIVE